jgi:hypothetical protein
MITWLRSVIFTSANAAKANDAWSLIVAGILSAGITLPADNQNWRPWAFGVATIILNIVVNAIRRVATQP